MAPEGCYSLDAAIAACMSGADGGGVSWLGGGLRGDAECTIFHIFVLIFFRRLDKPQRLSYQIKQADWGGWQCLLPTHASRSSCERQNASGSLAASQIL